MGCPAQVHVEGVEGDLPDLLQFIFDSFVVGGNLDIDLGRLAQLLVGVDEWLLKKKLILIYHQVRLL